MIKTIIELLQKDEYFGISKRIDVAKGLYEIPKSFSDGKTKLKRVIKSKR